MKIRKLLLVTLTLVVSVFVQCSQENKAGDKKATLSIIGENSSTLTAMMSLKDSYEKSNPNVHLAFKPSTFDEALEKSSSDFSNGSGLYDIILQYNFTLSPSVQNGFIYKIGELTDSMPKSKMEFEKDIFPGLWQEVGYYFKDIKNPAKGTEMISYPYVGISMVLMYNKTMFDDEANKAAFQTKYNRPLTVPVTWEELYQVSEFFTNPSKKTYGICMEGNGPYLVAEWTNFLFGMGGKYMDKTLGWNGDMNSTLLFNSQESVNALKYYTSLKPFNSGNYSSVTQADQMKIMTEGKTALAIAWTDLLYENIKTSTGFDDRFAFTVIPGGKSIVSGGSYFINKKSKFARQAANYIVDQLQTEQQLEMAKKGLCSPLQSVYNDPEVKKIPYSSALQQSLSRGGMGLEAGPDALMITEVLATYIQKAWSGELSPKAAMDQAQKEISTKRPEYFQRNN